MDITDNPRIKQLQEKLDKENDPNKLAPLIDELMKCIDEVEDDNGDLRSSSDK